MTAPSQPSGPADSPDVITFPPAIFATFFALGMVTDFAFPVAYAETDEREIFSFFVGFGR